MKLFATTTNLETISSKFDLFKRQTRKLHWKTNVYAEHQALGGFYDVLTSMEDEIIEKLMGYTGKKITDIPIDNTSFDNSISLIKTIKDYCNTLCEYGDQNGYKDISQISETLQGECAKTLYLLTLS